MAEAPPSPVRRPAFFGGDPRTERRAFQLIDLIGYLFSRHGDIRQDEVFAAIPGWTGSHDAVQQRWFRQLRLLRNVFGVALHAPPHLPPGTYRLDRSAGTALLLHARGLATGSSMADSIRSGNWTEPERALVIAEVLCVVARAPRSAPIAPAAIPLPGAARFDVFAQRWTQRDDLEDHHYHAIRLLRVRGGVVVASPWKAPPQPRPECHDARWRRTRTHIDFSA
jgi:hypothetical protein